VSDRDFVVEYVFAASLTMIHLSSICEELVLWTTPEFAFAEMDDRYSTGSSIMPQKKNPDVAELIRGRTGGTIGNLVSLLVLLKGLPMAYNRDLQEDKSPVLEITDTLVASLEILTEVIKTIRFDSDEMEEKTKNGFLNATDLADYLVTKGVPFRTAHEIVGKIVRYALKNKKRLEDLSMKRTLVRFFQY
jgi:argininosuccinate lyase